MAMSTEMVEAFSTEPEDQTVTAAPEQENCFPTGVTFNPSGDYIIADHANQCIKVWNSNRQYKTSFGQDHLSAVWDITSTKSGKLAVSDPIARNIKIFSKKGKFLAEGQGGMHLTEPYGIAYDKETARLAVTDKSLCATFIHDKRGTVIDVLSSVELSKSEYDGDDQGTTYTGTRYATTTLTGYSERLGGTIASLDTSGTALSGSQLMLPFGPVMLCPSYVAFSSHRDALIPTGNNPETIPSGRVVYISDTLQHCIYAYYVSGSGYVSSDGSTSGLLWTYGREGVDDYELQNPAGLCVDKAGNLLIADAGNCRIHCLDAHGRFLDYVLTWEDGIAEPQALTFCPQDGNLVFTEGTSGLVKKYTYNHEAYKSRDITA